MRAYSLINRAQSITGIMRIDDAYLYLKIKIPPEIEDIFSKELADYFSSKGFAVKSLYENTNMRMTSGQFSFSQAGSKTPRSVWISIKSQNANEKKQKILELLKQKHLTISEMGSILGTSYVTTINYVKSLRLNNQIEAKKQRTTKDNSIEWGLKEVESK